MVIGIAILRHRLFEIDIVIQRTLVYGVLTVLIVVIYIAIVGGLGAIFHFQTNVPLADWWQRPLSPSSFSQCETVCNVLPIGCCMGSGMIQRPFSRSWLNR